MKMQEIRKIAKDYGIKTGNMSKVSLVKTIQSNEGNFDCFASAEDQYCDQSHCTWRTDCFELAKKTTTVS